MSNRIQILQWREFGDDEDCLSVRAFGSDDDRDLRDIEADEHSKPAAAQAEPLQIEAPPEEIEEIWQQPDLFG